MKVDLIIGSLEMGGAERQLVGLAIELRRMGTDVEVVCFRGREKSLVADLAQADVPVVHLGESSFSPRAGDPARIGLRLVRRWGARRPDAVQAWLGDAQVTALPVARIMRVPVRVMAVRSMSSAVRMTPLKRHALRLAAAASTSVIANSATSLADPGWPLSDRPRYVVPNAVDVPTVSADPSIDPPTGVVLANFLPYKGHTVLLDALSQLADPPRMLFVGAGPMRDEITRRADGLGLSQCINLVDGVSDPWPLLLKSQFAVLPSFTEGMPNAVLESMAAGLPVIASGVGAIPDLISDGIEGLLVNPGDVDGLAQAIRYAMAQPNWRSDAGSRGRRKAEAFTWRAMAKQNLDIMERDHRHAGQHPRQLGLP